MKEDEIERCWKEALGAWDVAASLSPPEAWAGTKGKSHWKGEEPLAYIDLETRQVVVNFELLKRIGAEASLTAVLAHEIGHHVRYPHTLGLAAQLRLLEQRLVPGLKQSLTNLFFDLLVNEHVGRTRAAELQAVYRGFLRESAEEASPLFLFYLAVYEELWGLDPGRLVPPGRLAPMEKDYPGWRAQARMFVQTFYALATVHRQFVYFCSAFIRYIPDPSTLSYRIPMGGDVPDPDEDDWDAAVRGAGSEAAADALDEAREKGWLEDSGIEDRPEADPLASIDRITSHLPGDAKAAFRRALVSKHYKRLVDEHVLRLPATTPPPEAVLPSVLEEWEWGDSPRAIDWTGSVLAQGPLAPVRPLRRDLLPDEPSPRERDLPAVEVYLDTSGSMPDPQQSLNTMTLAAQILSASAIRKKGIVRGVVYSSGRPLVSEWMYEEETARRFFLSYAGGGTDYPFDLLKKFAEERADALRVIVSDSDFLWNVQQEGAMEKLCFGADRSRLLVAFLAAPEKQAREVLAPALRQDRFRLVLVRGLDQFARAAAGLADALLGA
ncbi:MAG TPA: M48 family metalloprotease [Vicinamibacteria bacterium]|nr:M48 family metalloprotease [Vicinamibacteria bacterium]